MKNEYRERLVELKKYLEEGQGSKLSGNTELVQYFALPYVNEPSRHPLYKQLLQVKHLFYISF
ncbi:unnamed protein product [Dracunculus medinensis]|uniref:ARMC9 CTLH-like domain-containing protein n=1 Tax=Dracunculus medinensis TaxID=318479 RepID=A0A0N4ULA5_DRAME|nr:unnamed protein product [Dracunculus medinensis]